MKKSEVGLLVVLCFGVMCVFAGVTFLSLLADPECRKGLIKLGVIKDQRMNPYDEYPYNYPKGDPNRWKPRPYSEDGY